MYTGNDLRQYQRDCANELGNWVYSLYPQTMQPDYLKETREGSNCYKFLDYLMKKKSIIQKATRNNIDEILKFYLSGYYKPIDTTGKFYTVVPESKNSTEAIIRYLKHTTYHLNVYILNWESYKLSYYSAPGLHEGHFPKSFSYRDCCLSFLNLDYILYENDNLITRLSSDIINYFLNNTYIFHTETILDKLIESVNIEKFNTTGLYNKCNMPSSELILVPTNTKFQNSLKRIKYILNKSRYSTFGFPDGIRITINAIETQSKTPDTRIDNIETEALNRAQTKKTQVDFIPLISKFKAMTITPTARGIKQKYKTKRKKKKK